ncbi:uncharacterized protein LAESUDRAFT_764035 [Laetiporus sulphureus 93-53]|uniref:Homeobox domain-containing protein n=1 Tax=Laetiporus sulphureus 93-53 TaxID=1314785 RepID=A0A165BIA7_9APHY|nr:uncharacterized protein LAESUDRAFT_764035 [Laetiporus sulphureus 93-53]KZT01110.1 hypothetical protein LAESUDRAFT_764035 [Laetiporus sulphureus 93-53]
MSDQQRSPKRSPSATIRTLFSHSTTNDSRGASATTSETTPAAAAAGASHEMTGQPRPEGAGRGGMEHGRERSSPSMSSSQGEMADTEMEAGPSHSSEGAQPAPAPPKKKRTRTLTTPHQSAVLHALLAQSRFPTTAMREEVGRAIGLSARKVQIWFQASPPNQRQKARRPRGQTSAPLTRPPQFGPFTNAPPAASASDAGAIAGPSGSSSQAPLMHFAVAPLGDLPGRGGPSTAGSARPSHHEAPVPQSHSSSAASTHLSGPGIPGPSRLLTQYSLPREAGDAARSHERSGSFERYHHALRPAEPFSPSQAATSAEEAWRAARVPPPPPPPPSSSSRHARPFSEDLRMQQREYTFALPPLVLGPERDSAHVPQASNRQGASFRPFQPVQPPPSAADHPHSRRWRTPEPEPSSSSSSSARHAALHIPPPFTLQPRPQWDDPAFSPFSRPRASSASAPGSHYAFGFGQAAALMSNISSEPNTGLPPILNPSRSPRVAGSPPFIPISESPRGRPGQPHPSASGIVSSPTSPRRSARSFNDDYTNDQYASR